MKYFILLLFIIFTSCLYAQNEISPKIDSTSVTNVGCYGGNTGSIAVWTSWKLGPKSLTYYCDNIRHSNDTSTPFNVFNNLSVGKHTVKVVYKQKYADSAVVTILGPQQLIDSCSGNMQCSANSGMVTVNVSGGTSGYTYSWTDASGNQKGTDSTVIGLSAGTYIVTVTDANKCTDTCSITLPTHDSSTPKYTAGDSISCGYIVYVDTTGDTSHPCSTHYLVCAFKDQGDNITWYNNLYTYRTTNAKLDVLFDRQNAMKIDSFSMAANVCSKYTTNDSCTGWYLPSVKELNVIYANLAIKGIGGFAQRGYWSSVEGSKTHTAWAVDFDTSNKQQVIPTRVSPNGRAIQRDKSNKSPVRAVCAIWLPNQ